MRTNFSNCYRNVSYLIREIVKVTVSICSCRWANILPWKMNTYVLSQLLKKLAKARYQISTIYCNRSVFTPSRSWSILSCTKWSIDSFRTKSRAAWLQQSSLRYQGSSRQGSRQGHTSVIHTVLRKKGSASIGILSLNRAITIHRWILKNWSTKLLRSIGCPHPRKIQQ